MLAAFCIFMATFLPKKNLKTKIDYTLCNLLDFILVWELLVSVPLLSFRILLIFIFIVYIQGIRPQENWFPSQVY